MNRYSVNLSTVFTEVPFLERFRKAAEAGFSSVECQFPYAYTIEEIRKELDQNRLSMELLNLPPGNWEKGDRGLAADPNRIEEFKRSVTEGIRYANGLGVKKIHCMAGVVSASSEKEKAAQVYKKNLYYAGLGMGKAGISLLIEPINTNDMPGYFLNDIGQAAEIIKVVNLQNVKLQFDFYHIERIHGNPLSFYQKYTDLTAHVQIADHPGRHEPGTGRMNYQDILRHLAATNKSMIGLEYNPKFRSEDSFEWLKSWGH
ncbi:hydroxypyruvate isomerase family protein [Cytobacillus sp. NCCP-133]|uniref:hydroxypyruvate isomerase family protein n=1 Tax=Cytobacillus sp. NCCP-133 TaxID=766848 RepID=UPI00222E9E97|nr:TIM barrel protein [Cytobacillus sp. NCCP-133]GLB60530.1 hydroxypyruvate isomerase [Cytobacillus sp. NCCP-133]